MFSHLFNKKKKKNVVREDDSNDLMNPLNVLSLLSPISLWANNSVAASDVPHHSNDTPSADTGNTGCDSGSDSSSSFDSGSCSDSSSF